MEEQINKKSIVTVFLALLIIFLFIYKGLILSGEEYFEEYNAFRTSTEKLNQTGMKKAGINSSSAPKSSYLQKKVYDVLQNLEDQKLNLGAMKHTLKNNELLLVENLNKIINSGNITMLKEIVNDVENNKDKKVNVDLIIDSLGSNIETLRVAVKENN